MSKQHELNIDGLKSFIEKATKLGKYPANTATGYLTAVKTVERALLDDEPKTLEYLLGHIEELFVRQDLKLSPQSLPVYMNRIKTVCNDYSKYGTDGTSIYKWTRATRVRSTKVKEDKTTSQTNEVSSAQPKEDDFGQVINNNNSGTRVSVLSWRLRPGLITRIELPEDLNEQDVEKLKALLDIELKFGH